MDKQTMIIGLITLGVFVIPIALIKFLSARKKQKINKALRNLMSESGIASETLTEVSHWIMCLDTKKSKLAIIDKKAPETNSQVIEIAQLKGCNLSSETDGGNLVQLDIVITYKDSTIQEKRFAFYKLGIDSHFDAHTLQQSAEKMQTIIRSSMSS